ncbi:formyltransferase family protein [Methylobacterium durans]|uniref:formyltransferase family protein n=1 Tax=Methylobacterium durans TaxID=2202825 RepID=UPI002AFF2826|nr:formyltransferase family protein [Methylobacterium durans]MEA1835248.1 formyltransferase family protein [Methylobacterium durans]
MGRPRLAIFALEALPNARTLRRFVAEHAAEIAFVGLSNAERPSTGGFTGQIRRHLARSGPGFLAYLGVNFGLPDLMRPLAPVTRRFSESGDAPEATPLEPLCRRLGLPALKVDDVNGPAVAEALRGHRADLILTFHFDQILSAATLAAVPLGGLNVHPGLLPRHRGPVPTIHALNEGPDTFGITVQHLAVAIDTGAILAQEAVRLPADVTATRASVLLHERGRVLVDGILEQVAAEGRLPTGRTFPTLPYCGFPDRAMLKDLRRRGLRLTDARDLREAASLNA